MQAIILAAGMGKRLGALTKDNTKCMVRVNGETLIDRVLTQLSTLGLSRVVIVTGYKGAELRAHIADRYAGRLAVEYIDNPVYDRTNNIYSLFLAREVLMEDDTLLLESDLIFDDALLRMAAKAEMPNVALVAKYEPWMDGTMVRIDDECNITGFVPKQAFSYSEADTYYKTVNIYKFSRQFSRQRYIPFLEAYCKALGNNEYYEQVLRVITFLSGGAELKALPVGGHKWYEIDDIQDLDIAETLFADKAELMHRYNMRYGGHWRFPKLLDFCYLVNPYFPPRRLREELKASFDTLLSEYPSGMYVNSLLAAKYFGVSQSKIVVGNGAAELIKSLTERLTGRVGVIYPTFQEYPNRLPTERIVAFSPTDSGLRYGADELMAYFSGANRVDTLLLINPDNPSGNFIAKADVLRLAAWCEAGGTRLVVDESFVDFSRDFRTNSLFNDALLEAHPHLVVLKSISKSYGVPGLRLGVMASADKALIDFAKRDVSIWNINSFAEYYLQIYGKYQSDYERACERFIAERDRFMQRLSAVSFLRVLPSEANYFLCQVLPPFTSASLTLRLMEQHDILIKDCEDKDGLAGRNFVRIAVRDTADNDRLAEVLETIDL
ncbi:MAG: aminotransferase class I/II-fold pyridoxal phosphate-dependent enzyme [Bacteroidaceae bacterium]|nr:aminotransferase class I/II-fold pyridoxal phosphate-dependent enzyme [Bacteroidaceae bacterium]